MSEDSVKKPQLANLQFARLLAAVIVLIGHLFHEAADQGFGQVHLGQIDWTSGVDVFFIISGFVMGLQDPSKFGSLASAKEFLRRRLIRIVPLYWLFTTLMIVAAVVFASRVAHSAIDPAHVAASFAFIPWPRYDGAMRPFLIAGWTLNYEMIFYVVFAIGLLFRRGLYLIFASLIALAVAGMFIPESAHALHFWTRPIILEFLYGIGLALLFNRGIRVPLAGQWALVLGGLGLLVTVITKVDVDASVRPFWTGIPAALIVAGFVFGPEPKTTPLTRALKLGGDSSYALYLGHPFAINICAIILAKLHIKSLPIYVMAGGIASIAAAVIVYLCFEKPVLKLLGGVTSKDPRAKQVAEVAP